MAYPISRRLLKRYLLNRITVLEGTENIPHSGGTLFVSNHVGWHDPLLIVAAIVYHGGFRKLHPIARWPIFKIPLFRRWTGAIPLYDDRQKTIELATKKINAGGNVLIYPEGGTNKTQVIPKVKTGAARLALFSKCTVIPVGVTRLSPERTSFVGELKEIFTEKLEMRFGKPIDLSAWYNTEVTKDLIYEVSDHIMQHVASLAGKTYKRV